MTDRLTPQREAEIPAALAAYATHPDLGFACCTAHAVADHVPALLAELAAVRAERDQAQARVAELERAAVEARAALGSLCYDLEDPGTAALGALHLLTQATVWTETGPDFAAEALAQHDAKVLGAAQDRIAELEERDDWLSALEAAGVDNWEGYDDALEIAGEAS